MGFSLLWQLQLLLSQIGQFLIQLECVVFHLEELKLIRVHSDGDDV